MKDYVDEMVHELIDAFIDQGECECVGDFCIPRPCKVIEHDKMFVDQSNLLNFHRSTLLTHRRATFLGTFLLNLPNSSRMMTKKKHLQHCHRNSAHSDKDNTKTHLSRESENNLASWFRQSPQKISKAKTQQAIDLTCFSRSKDLHAWSTTGTKITHITITSSK